MSDRRGGSRAAALSSLSAVVSLLIAVGCAANRPATGSGGVRAITEAEIRASEADDVLELIQLLRPAWLAGSLIGDPSSPTEMGGPVVLINDIPPKPLYSLQFLPLENIREIRFLTRTTAETRFRVEAIHGLILVLTYFPVMPRDTLAPDTGGRAPGPPVGLIRAHPDDPLSIWESHND